MADESAAFAEDLPGLKSRILEQIRNEIESLRPSLQARLAADSYGKGTDQYAKGGGGDGYSKGDSGYSKGNSALGALVRSALVLPPSDELKKEIESVTLKELENFQKTR